MRNLISPTVTFDICYQSMGILRLSHVDITVTDLELAAAYYTQVMGLELSLIHI